MAYFVLILLMHVIYSESSFNLSRTRDIALESSEFPMALGVKVAILRINKHIKKPISSYRQYKLNELYNTILRQGPSFNKYLYGGCENSVKKDLRTISTSSTWDEAIIACVNNCTNVIARQCNECIEETVEALAFSCKRMCHVRKNEKKYLHDFDLQAGERRCKKMMSRCCTHNCLRQLGKACFTKKQLCTRETMEILKRSCFTKCSTHSSNVYLNNFCSFAHTPHYSIPKKAPFPFFDY